MMMRRVIATVCSLTALVCAPGCFAPSATTFHVRPHTPPILQLRTPLTLHAVLESVSITRNGKDLVLPDRIVAGFARDWQETGIFQSVQLSRESSGAADRVAKLRMKLEDTYARDAVANIGKMFLSLVTLSASSTVLQPTADLDQTMTVELSLPTGATNKYVAQSATTHSMAASSPTEDALHWERVTSTNFTALIGQVRANPDLRRWEAHVEPEK